MKTLFTYINDIAVLTPLNEGLLSCQESVLSDNNPYKDEYPVPTVKDFFKYKTKEKGSYDWDKSQSVNHVVEWYCPKLLNDAFVPLENKFLYDARHNRHDCESMNIYITYNDATPEHKTIYIKIFDSRDCEYSLYTIQGFDTTKSIQSLKKECIAFLNALSENPELITKMIMYHDDAARNDKKLSYKDIIKL